MILLQKTHAGEFKKQFLAKHGNKVGYKRVKTLPAIEPYLVVHLSARSACDVQSAISSSSSSGSSGGGGCSYGGSSSHEYGEGVCGHIPFEFFAGVRMADPVFGFPELLCLPIQNSSSDNSSNTSDASSPSSSPSFTFAEVFAGIGGFRLGLEGAQGLGGRCVFASEIDEAARSTYQLNFRESSSASPSCSGSSLLGDVSDYYAQQFPDHDLLTGGFPCQSFSDRGEQRGLDDARGQLYTELVRILQCKQPRAFLFENVASLVTMAGGKRNRLGESEEEGLAVGRTFATILAALRGCGYSVSHHMVDARHFLPQHRERVYIAGFRRDLGVSAVGGLGWPQAETELLRRAGCTPDTDTGTGTGTAPLLSASSSTVRDILEEEHCVDPSLTLTAAQWSHVQHSQQREAHKQQQWVAKQAHQRGGGEGGGEGGEGERNGGVWRRLGGRQRSREIDLDGKAPTLISGYKNHASVSTRFVYQQRDGSALPATLPVPSRVLPSHGVP